MTQDNEISPPNYPENDGPDGFAHPEHLLKQRQRKYASYFRQDVSTAPAEHPILDLGCGPGFFLDLLVEEGLRAVGVDLSVSAIDRCRARGHDRCHVADAMEFLEQSRSTFSGVFCSHVVEHMLPAKVTRLLKAVARRLAPGGRLVALAPNPVNLHVAGETFHLDPQHVRPYPRLLLEAMCRDAGLSVIASGWDPDTAPHPPRWKWLLHLSRSLVLGRHYREGEDTFVVAEKPR